jgi:hypothetical protein
MLKYSFLLLITHESAEYREASITTFRYILFLWI